MQFRHRIGLTMIIFGLTIVLGEAINHKSTDTVGWVTFMLGLGFFWR